MAKQSPRIAERRTMAGKNPTARQVETSMSKKYKGTPKVSQSTIDRIKGMGMTKALKSAATNKNPEFREGLRRMYGAKRVNQAMKPVKKAAPAMAQKQSPRVVERTRPAIKKQSPRVAERMAAKKAPAKKAVAPSSYTPSDYMKAKQAMGARGRARMKGLFGGKKSAPAKPKSNQQFPGAQRSR